MKASTLALASRKAVDVVLALTLGAGWAHATNAGSTDGQLVEGTT